MPCPEIYDGLSNALGGMNANLRPWLLPENQVANLINGVCRGGAIGQRPAFRSSALSFGPGAQAKWYAGSVQCAGVYQYPGAPTRIFVAISGQILRMTPQTDGSFYVELFLPAGDQGNNSAIVKAYMCQSDKWFIVQDGVSIPLLIYGDTVRRATTVAGDGTTTFTEIPIGTYMAYGYGRTWICTGSREYKASDLIGERGAVDGTGAQSGYEVVTFDDQQYLAENASFLLPTKFGPVTGMAFVNQQDTATGQGPLIVFGQNGAEAVNASAERTTWQTTQIQVEALTNIGAQGDQSIVNVNGDLFFRAVDGWRSYKQARAEQGQWGSLPMSTAVRPYIDADAPANLMYTSAIFFGNRLLMTCAPQIISTFFFNNGILALDFDPISTSLGVSTQPPAWDGYWMPPRPPAKLISGVFLGSSRAFAICTQVQTNSAGQVVNIINTLDEILETHRLDDDTAAITTTIQTRAFNFQSPFQEKELVRIEASYFDRANSTSFGASYRSNNSLIYQPLTMALSSETGPPGTIKGQTFNDTPHYTVDNRSSFPDVSGNTSDTRLNRRFYRVQLQIVLTGSQILDQIRVVARPEVENKRGGNT